MNIRKAMKLLKLTEKKMLRWQPELKNLNWQSFGMNSDNYFTRDYKNNLTEKGKVAAVIGLVNGYLRIEGKQLFVTRKGMDINKIC